MKSSVLTVRLGSALLVGMTLWGCQKSGTPHSASLEPSESAETRKRPSSDAAESPSGTSGPEKSLAEGKTDEGNKAPEDKAELWRRFAEAWNAVDAGRLKTFQARGGLIALDNPGAFVRMRLLRGPEDIQRLEGDYDLARLKRVRLKADLAPGEAPKPSCEDDVRLTGTLRAPADRPLLGVRFRALGEYELASPSEIAQLEGPVKTATETARYAVYDLDANVGFLFGAEGDRMVLLALDAVIPCSA